MGRWDADNSSTHPPIEQARPRLLVSARCYAQNWTRREGSHGSDGERILLDKGESAVTVTCSANQERGTNSFLESRSPQVVDG